MAIRPDLECVKEAFEKAPGRPRVDMIRRHYCQQINGKPPTERTIEAVADLSWRVNIEKEKFAILVSPKYLLPHFNALTQSTR